MNNLSPNENVDRLLSAFFKAEMPDPWPAAPLATASSEPAALVAERGGAPRNEPAVARRDHNSRARYTLAASVALLLGTCWTLSNGFQSGNGPARVPANGTNPDVLSPSNAKTPDEIRNALTKPPVPAPDKNDMFGKSN
jgi:hypothetical protein